MTWGDVLGTSPMCDFSGCLMAASPLGEYNGETMWGYILMIFVGCLIFGLLINAVISTKGDLRSEQFGAGEDQGKPAGKSSAVGPTSTRTFPFSSAPIKDVEK